SDPATFVSDLDEPDGISGGLRLALTAALEQPVLDVGVFAGADVVDPRDPIVRHEALDRASMLAGVVEHELLDHPAVQGDVLIRAAVQRAVDALSEAYQAAGQEPPPSVAVEFDEANMTVRFGDGRVVTVPLERFPRLLNATAEQRLAYWATPSGLHWDAIDEDVSFADVLAQA
ncbi:MAG: DUF2442 domain-containing protein, partial [Allosphingosinicella sp.]